MAVIVVLLVAKSQGYLSKLSFEPSSLGSDHRTLSDGLDILIAFMPLFTN